MTELHAPRLDREGRVVIPAAVRRALFWGPGTPVVVTASGFDQVTIARAEDHCLFCHSVTIRRVLGRPVCAACAAVVAAGWRP